MHISFIGFGAMATAIAQGLLQTHEYTLSAAAPRLKPGITEQGIHTYSDNRAAVGMAQCIVLAVKPLQMRTVLEEIAAVIPPGCCVISVAAGLRLAWFATYLGKHTAIIRAMPNVGAALGLSATPLCANAAVTAQQKHGAQGIFDCIGMTAWVQDEEEIDTLTALSGSGPAYVFLFMEAMIAAGVRLGLSEAVAKSFTLQTCKGALALAQHPEATISELRHSVTSPNGTTAAALAKLHPQLFDLMYDALLAATLRAKELGQAIL